MTEEALGNVFVSNKFDTILLMHESMQLTLTHYLGNDFNARFCVGFYRGCNNMLSFMLCIFCPSHLSDRDRSSSGISVTNGFGETEYIANSDSNADCWYAIDTWIECYSRATTEGKKKHTKTGFRNRIDSSLILLLMHACCLCRMRLDKQFCSIGFSLILEFGMELEVDRVDVNWNSSVLDDRVNVIWAHQSVPLACCDFDVKYEVWLLWSKHCPLPSSSTQLL